MASKKKLKLKQYIFIDESGKPEVFSSKGINLVENGNATKYMILAAIRTTDQLKVQKLVIEFKLKLLDDPELKKLFSPAYSLDAFHAHNDYPEVRKLFYEFIASLPNIMINVYAVDKLKCFEHLKRNPTKMYGVMTGHLLSDLCHQYGSTEVIFSRQTTYTRSEIETEVSRLRLRFLQTHPTVPKGFSLVYSHNPHYSHGALQIADYVAYALFQLFEKGDRQYYDIIKDKIGHVADVCNKKFYTQSNPL